MGTAWQPKYDAALKALVADGLTFSKIADAMTEKFRQSFTRNMCCGRAHRLGVKSDPDATTDARSASAAGNTSRHKGKVLRIAATVPPPKPVAPDLPVLRCVEVSPRHLRLIDLGPDDCRWPYGDGPFTFCGNPFSFKDASYCGPHFALSRRER